MNAENHHFVLGYRFQILTQPFDLSVGESAVVYRRIGAENIVHADNVCVSAVERVVDRTEFRFEVALCRQIDRAAAVADFRRGAVIVIAHDLKYLDADVALLHGGRHLPHRRRRDVFAVGVEDHVAESDAIDRRIHTGGVFLDIRHRFLFEAGYVGVRLNLRIRYAEEFEFRFDGLFGSKREIVTFLRFGKTLPEAGKTVGHLYFPVGGNPIIDMERIFVAGHLIHSVFVALDAREAVAHDDAR